MHMMTLLASPEGKNPAYHAYYARHLLQRDDVAAAEDQLVKLEQALPDAPLTREIKARVRQAKGRDDEAIAVVREYAQGKDADLAGAALLLESLGQKRNPKGIYTAEAEALYRKYVAQSDKPERFLTLAGFLGRKHAVAEALSCCENALRHKVNPEAVAQVMTSVLREAPSEEKEHGLRVEKILKDMLANTPESISLLICLADLYDLRKRFAEAEVWYRQVLLKESENLVALNNLAWLLAFQQSPAREEALVLANKAIDLVGPSPELLDTRGVIYLMLGQGDRGLKDLEEAIAQSPSPNCAFHLARALAAANKLRDVSQIREEASKRGFDVNQLHPLEKSSLSAADLSLANELSRTKRSRDR
jgi:tetratricopeptide (TPR) repeat protein